MQALPPLTFASWTRALSARGYGVLPASHAVPVSLWLRDDSAGPGDGSGEGRVLHYSARGTRLRLAAYRPSDLTTLILRAACDCAEHRQAGATGRVALNPGSRAAGGARARRRQGVRLATATKPPSSPCRRPPESWRASCPASPRSKHPRRPVTEVHPTAPRRREGALKTSPSRRKGAPKRRRAVAEVRSGVALLGRVGSVRCTSGTGGRCFGALLGRVGGGWVPRCGHADLPHRHGGGLGTGAGVRAPTTRPPEGGPSRRRGSSMPRTGRRCRGSSSGTTRTCASRCSC